MSNKEKALDALQQILHISGSLMPTHANNEIIGLSESIRSALGRIPEQPITEVHISCFYTSDRGASVPISKAQDYYNQYDKICSQCGACQ